MSEHVRYQRYPPGTLCSVPGCEKHVRAKTLCSTHYQNQRENRGKRSQIKLVPSKKKPGPKPRTGPGPVCSIPGCGYPARGRGLCGAHYLRLRQGKPLELPVKGRVKLDPLRPCRQPDCDRPVHARGLCSKHYRSLFTSEETMRERRHMYYLKYKRSNSA